MQPEQGCGQPEALQGNAAASNLLQLLEQAASGSNLTDPGRRTHPACAPVEDESA